MSIHVIHADLSNLPFYVDFILNTANPEPRDGNGLDRAIYQKAGPEMREDRKKIGNIAPGDIAITKGYGLNTQGVIHAVSALIPKAASISWRISLVQGSAPKIPDFRGMVSGV